MPDFVIATSAVVALLGVAVAAAALLHVRRREKRLGQALREREDRLAALQAQHGVLAKEQDLFRRLQEFGKTAYIISDLMQDRIYWSDNLFALRRVPRRPYFSYDEAIQFLHPEDREKYSAARNAAVAERRDWELDNRVLRGDGTIGWEHAIGRPQFDAAGKLIGALVILQDVTERVAHEEENRRLSLVATHTNNSVVISSLDGRIEWVNDAFTRSTGYSLAEVRGQRALDLLRGPESDPAVIAFARERASRGEGFRDLEILNYSKSGASYWMNIEAQPVRDAEGKVVQVVSVGTNITTRKAAEAELKASHEKFAGAFHGSSDAMGVASIGPEAGTAVLQDVNEAAERLFGRSRSELIGNRLFELMDWADRERLLELGQRLRQEGLVRDFPGRLHRPDGSAVDILVTASRYFAAGQAYVIFVIRDVSVARRTEHRIQELYESLAASLRQLRAIADNLPALVVYLDAERRFRFMNRTAERWLATSLAEVEGRTVDECMPGEFARATKATRDNLAEGSRREEAVVSYPDGVTRAIEAVYVPDIDSAGNLKGFYVLVVDLSERRAAERKIEESQAMFVGAFQNSNDAMTVASVGEGPGTGLLLDVNEAWEHLLGFSRQEAIGGMASVMGVYVDIEDMRTYRDRVLVETQVRNMPVRLRTKAGEIIETLISGSRFVADAKPYVLTVIRDITAARAAERALKESEARFAGAFHSSIDAMTVTSVVADAGGGIFVDVNSAAEQLVGYSRDELIGRSYADVGHVVDIEDLRTARRAMVDGQPLRNLPVRIRHKDGHIIHTLVSGSTFSVGGTVYYITVTRDVTEARLAEQKILELNESLAASLRQVRAIADNLPALVIYLDAERRIRFMNRTAERWLASSFAAVEGKTVEEFMPDDYLQSTKAARQRLAEGHRREEAIIHYPDGVTRSVEGVYVPDMHASGHLLGYYVLVVDLSERRAAEAALEETRAMFTGAFQNSIDAMTVTSIAPEPGSSIFVDVNAAAEKLIGYSREELVGHTYAEIGHVVDVGDIQAARAAVVEGRPLHNMPVRIRHKSGHVIDTLMSGSSFVAGGKPYYFTVTRDVTAVRAAERKILELNESLAASLRQIRAIADNIPALIVYIDGEGHYRFLNRTAERWLAVSAEVAIGKTGTEVMPADYLAATKADRDRVLAGPARIEITVRYPDGVTRNVEVNSVPEIDSDGQIHGHYVFAVDISERRAIEEQLRQSQKLEAIGKLTGGVAHDFNNLLAVISGNLELAEEALTDRDDVRDILRPALRATERGATLTQSLLAYARQQPLSPSAVDVSNLVRDMTGLLRRTIPASIEFRLDVGADLWKCYVDAGQLQNALLNLVVNARDAMPHGGRLTIEIANAKLDDDYAAAHAEVTPGEYVMLAVSDTGSGMTPEVVARAFEPFFTTKSVGKGTGLGLSMVYGFAKQSLGHVKIYSEPGHGTTIRIYLPRAAAEVTVAAATSVPEDLAGRGETILVVEDDPDLRTVAFSLLRSLGYEVLEAAGAEAAVRVLQTSATIALMLTDVVLAGGMNGRQLAELMAELRPDMRVLYMSGYTENAILHHGRLDQGVRFLQKPFSKQDLARKVRLMLNQARPS